MAPGTTFPAASSCLAGPGNTARRRRPGTYQSVCGSSTTSSTLAFLAAAGAGASTRPAEAAVCFTAWDSELKKLLPTDGAAVACGAGCDAGAGAGAGGGLRSGPGETAGGAEEAEAAPGPGGGGGGCWGSGRCRSVM